MATETKRRRVGLAVGFCLTAFVVLSVFLGGPSGPIEAQGYKCYSKKYIPRCKRGCGSYKKSTARYNGKAVSYAKRNCRTTLQHNKSDCAGDKGCVAQAIRISKGCFRNVGRAALRARKALARAGGLCSKCCGRTCGTGSCTGYFSPGLYTGVRTGKPSTAFLDVSDQIRHRLARLVPWAVDGWGE